MVNVVTFINRNCFTANIQCNLELTDDPTGTLFLDLGKILISE